MKEKDTGYYIAEFGGYALAVAMFVFLAYRTYDFLAWTFRADQVLFAYLGLFATTGGAIIWGLIYRFSNLSNQMKAVAMSMMAVDLLGELLLAVADMTLVTAEKGAQYGLSAGQLTTAIWLSAGLAALNGVAIFFKIMHNPSRPNG